MNVTSKLPQSGRETMSMTSWSTTQWGQFIFPRFDTWVQSILATYYFIDFIVLFLINRKEKEYNQGLSCWGKFKFWWDKYIWSSRPNFQYSTRIVCTIFVVFCCTYQVRFLTVILYYFHVLLLFSLDCHPFADWRSVLLVEYCLCEMVQRCHEKLPELYRCGSKFFSSKQC